MVYFCSDILTGSKDGDHKKWKFLFCLSIYAVSSKSSCICPYNFCELTMVLTIVRANTGSFKTFLITLSEYFEKTEFKYSKLCCIMTNIHVHVFLFVLQCIAFVVVLRNVA